jgi:hypothetical protein
VENADGGGSEFVIHGVAAPITDPHLRAEYDSFAIYKPKERYILFELMIVRVLATTYPEGSPVRQHWPEPA